MIMSNDWIRPVVELVIGRNIALSDAWGVAYDWHLSTEEARMPQPNRRKLKRYVVAPAALLLAAYVGWFCYTRINYRPEPRTAYWEARLGEINPPWPDAIPFENLQESLGDIEQFVFAGSDSLGYQGVTELLCGDWDPASNQWVSPAIALFESDAFTASYGACREAFRRGWILPVEFDSDAFPHMGAYTWTRLLIANSRYLHESRHDVTAQCAVWCDLLEACVRLDQTKSASGIRTAANARIELCAEILAVVSEFDRGTRIPTLPGLMPSAHERQQSNTDRFARSILLDRANLDRIFVPEGWLDVACAFERTFETAPRTHLWNLTSPVFLDRSEAETEFSVFLGKLDRCRSSLDLLRVFDGDRFREAETARLLIAYPIVWREHYVLSAEYCYRANTCRDATATMIALHNYAIDVGTYPQTLDDLVPSYLPRLPIDDGDGKTLRYRREGDRFVLYSVGRDGIDDAGKVPDKQVRITDGWYQEGTDVVFSMWKRPKRGVY